LKNLLELLEADEPRARDLLRRFMPPVVLTPKSDGGFSVTGGFDLEATLDDGSSRGSEPLLLASNSGRDPLHELSKRDVGSGGGDEFRTTMTARHDAR
jgi:hypothetical protein